ncbi:hypothetical protein [Streptomyces sp. V2]|uniref:Uncharacterized protein n=1 Tax=Streptomyces niveiscabiei TaxID=164115 RepID=A0ABW9I6E9_9ACTN|nr:hypothetical protein [Streptomyces sp. V2]
MSTGALSAFTPGASAWSAFMPGASALTAFTPGALSMGARADVLVRTRAVTSTEVTS